MDQPSSNIFEGYKCVGIVTNSKPFLVRHGKNPHDSRIVAVVGRTFHTYTTNLSLVEVSLPHEHDINCIIADEDYLYSASDRSILCWNRGSKTIKIKLDNGHQAPVTHVTKLGKSNIASVDEDNVLYHWRLNDKTILNIISFDEYIFKITAICSPLNYKQKVLIGSKQGQLQLWNVFDETCLFKFGGWNSEVTCLTQSPIEDVIGIGLEDGNIYIHNIRYDEVVMKIYQEYGRITSMSFRLDGQPYLVTASEVGHLMIWNLERKRLSTQIRNAHIGPISKCQFIRNESLMVTSGHDNCLKIWTMDSSDGGGNLLNQRSGHNQPPTFIRFYGPKGFNLLSAGNDSTMKMFHMYSERLNRNLGTARINPKSKTKDKSNLKKLPPITCFAAEVAREKQWDNIAACHLGTSLTTTWNYDKCRMGEHVIMQPSFDKHNVVAQRICITSCGNFMIIGFSNGLIFKYNMQSGKFRQTFEDEKLKDHLAHDGSITGLTVDALDIVLISGSSDKMLKIWNFKTSVLLMTWDCPASITMLELHKENNLIAVALDTNDIEIRDLEARTLVRQFPSSSKIMDMAFTPDSRWLIVAYQDKSIRTWDLNLGKMIDAFRLSEVTISLSISSTGEFLATVQENCLGISIWCNYTIYCPTTMKSIDPDVIPPQLDMPFVRCDDLLLEEDEEGDDIDGHIEPDNGAISEPEYISPGQLSESLITLSGLPSSRWKNLLNIQELREKQLIQEEEKRERPIKVPFFIPVKDGLKPQLDEEEMQKLQTKGDAILMNNSNSKIRQLTLLSPLAKCLIECGHKNEYEAFLKQMKELGPSLTDAEIRSLGTDTCGDNKPMLCFLDAIEYCLKTNRDYELIISWLALYLKAHSDLIQTDADIQRRLRELNNPVRSRWDRIRLLLDQLSCVLNFIRSSIL